MVLDGCDAITSDRQWIVALVVIVNNLLAVVYGVYMRWNEKTMLRSKFSKQPASSPFLSQVILYDVFNF